jgi:hypothetical protein
VGLRNVISVRGSDVHSIALIANETNLWPNAYVSPLGTLTNPTQVVINAKAVDWDGTVAKVEFYLDDQLLGSDATSLYSITWSAPVIGIYSVRARVTDDLGASKFSAPQLLTITANLDPTADAHVKQATPTSNFGSAALLEVQNASGNSRVTYLKFDPSNVPVVTSAKLRFYAVLSGNGTVPTTLYSVPDTTWTESAVTWNNRPALDASLAGATVTKTPPGSSWT